MHIPHDVLIFFMHAKINTHYCVLIVSYKQEMTFTSVYPMLIIVKCDYNYVCEDVYISITMLHLELIIC